MSSNQEWRITKNSPSLWDNKRGLDSSNGYYDWNFACRVNTPKYLTTYTVCQFNYIDYSGERLTDTQKIEVTFEKKINESDVLLGLIDGQKVLEFAEDPDNSESQKWVIEDFSLLLKRMTSVEANKKPIHFVISKWDLFEGKYSFKEIRQKLEEIKDFKDLIATRRDAEKIFRLIPISALGKGFAILENGEMKKISKSHELSPFHVEIPLACVLPDAIQQKLADLVVKNERLERQLETPKRFWEKAFDYLKSAAEALPSIAKTLDLPEDIIISTVKILSRPSDYFRENREARIEVVREQLQTVKTESDAFKFAVTSFKKIQDGFNQYFPESDLLKSLED